MRFVPSIALQKFAPDEPIEKQWNRAIEKLNAWMEDVTGLANVAVTSNGERVWKTIPTTLSSGATQFETFARSDTVNATFGGGVWKSHDTARVSWRSTQDMSADTFTVRRAAASSGNLSWTSLLTLTSDGHLQMTGHGQFGTSAGIQVLGNQKNRTGNGTSEMVQASVTGQIGSFLVGMSARESNTVFATQWIATGVNSGGASSANLHGANNGGGMTIAESIDRTTANAIKFGITVAGSGGGTVQLGMSVLMACSDTGASLILL